NLLLGQLDLGSETIRGGDGGIKGLLGLHTFFNELLSAVKLDFSVAQLDLEVRNRRLRGVPIGLGGVQSAAGIGIVERGEKLVFAEARALVEEDSGDTAGNLGGDGGATPRRNVTAGIEDASRAGSRLASGGDLDFGLTVVVRGSDSDHQGNQNHGQDDPKPAPTSAGVAAFGVSNAQGRQIGLQGLGCCRHTDGVSSTGEVSHASHCGYVPRYLEVSMKNTANPLLGILQREAGFREEE